MATETCHEDGLEVGWFHRSRYGDGLPGSSVVARKKNCCFFVRKKHVNHSAKNLQRNSLLDYC
jgi:hypothetical protein